MTKNIVVVSIDALRFDRLGIGGNRLKTSPTIDRMSKNSIWCSSCFSLAPSTQPSMPTIMTSTRPLSFGGYDSGVLYRPNMIPEVLNKNGWVTNHAVTFPWLRNTYGYSKGVTHVDHLYDIKGIVGATVHTFRSYVNAYYSHELSKEELRSFIEPIVNKCFSDLLEYCDDKLAKAKSEKSTFVSSYFSVQGYDFKKIIRVVEQHRIEFENDFITYVDAYLKDLPPQSANLWISKEIIRTKSKKYRAQELINKITRGLLGKVRPQAARFARFRNKVYVDSAELTNHVISTIDNSLDSCEEKPFYIWAHYLDTHLPYIPGSVPVRKAEACSYLEKVGYQVDTDISLVCGTTPRNEDERKAWLAAYDCSVRYTDDQIKRIIEHLKVKNLLEDTIVVVMGDHGEEIGEHGQYGHRFRFYDECVRVPLMFFNPKFTENRIEGLTDLSDFAPTVLGLVGIQPPDTYIGKDLSKGEAGREVIEFEVFHRGNCHFVGKPLYMAVRNTEYKYIWREWQDAEDKSDTEDVELYDLSLDPMEKRNIARKNPDVVKKMHRYIADRLKEIPDFLNNRSTEQLDAALNGPGWARCEENKVSG